VRLCADGVVQNGVVRQCKAVITGKQIYVMRMSCDVQYIFIFKQWCWVWFDSVHMTETF
jgi:hypothetical protein